MYVFVKPKVMGFWHCAEECLHALGGAGRLGYFNSESE